VDHVYHSRVSIHGPSVYTCAGKAHDILVKLFFYLPFPEVTPIYIVWQDLKDGYCNIERSRICTSFKNAQQVCNIGTAPQ
jgi:hypothetical protein